MGNYISQTGATSGDLTNAIGNSTILMLASDGAGGADAAAIADVIMRAESLVNAHLQSAGFVVPYVPTAPATMPEILKTIAVDLAIYYLYARKPEFLRTDGRNPYAEPFKVAMKLLEDIRDGGMSLGQTGAVKATTEGGSIYGRAESGYFICDPNEGTDGPTGGF